MNACACNKFDKEYDMDKMSFLYASLKDGTFPGADLWILKPVHRMIDRFLYKARKTYTVVRRNSI